LFYSSYASATVAPNPAKDFINIYLVKTGNQPARIQLMNAEGKIVYNTTSAQSILQINTKGFSKGLYFVKVIDAGNVIMIKVAVQ
jgi:peptidyl-tRNA hydrolase